jgi:NAD(P)-dependent dehydrogenase (short-subunit alcohol dehydrogenase family)
MTMIVPVDDVLGYTDRHAVVVGAATGMGAATTTLLTQLGARVTALDVKPVSLAGVTAVEVDLRDERSIDAAVAAIDAPVHSVFSCAGVAQNAWPDLDVMLVNFVGQRHLIESLVPTMPAGSAVATIASVGGLRWEQHLDVVMPLVTSDGFAAGRAWCEANADAVTGSYRRSKEAMNAWVAWRASTLIRQGIRLNTLNPGPTDTPLMPIFERNSGAASIDELTQPIGRRSTAGEQAWPLLFLNSPRSSYVNGHALFADGGWWAAARTGQAPARL